MEMLQKEIQEEMLYKSPSKNEDEEEMVALKQNGQTHHASVRPFIRMD